MKLKLVYRELIGYLLYVTLTTRPDLSFAVNYYSRYQSQPKTNHSQGLESVFLLYIKGTFGLGILYSRNQTWNLAMYADSDWSNDVDRKSASGYVVHLGNKLPFVVIPDVKGLWRFRLQKRNT